MVGLAEFRLKEGKILHNSSAVSDVGISQTGLLNFVLYSLQVANWVVIKNNARVFDETMKLSIAGLGVHADFLILTHQLDEVV